MATPRMTLTTQAVLKAFLDDLSTHHYGLEIGALTSLPSGTVHPILARLEALGWAESYWEEIDATAEGRPRRRYYRLSEDGVASARLALAQAGAARVKLSGRLRPIGEPG